MLEEGSVGSAACQELLAQRQGQREAQRSCFGCSSHSHAVQVVIPHVNICGERRGIVEEGAELATFAKGNRSPLCSRLANVSTRTREEDDGGDVGRKLMC